MFLVCRISFFCMAEIKKRKIFGKGEGLKLYSASTEKVPSGLKGRFFVDMVAVVLRNVSLDGECAVNVFKGILRYLPEFDWQFQSKAALSKITYIKK